MKEQSRKRFLAKDSRRERRDAKHGAGYDRFRTGLTYAQVRQMLWMPDADKSKWRHKRRGTVLGMWTELKQQMWQQLLDAAE